MPVVTVLMPVHNGAAYLSEAVDSILQQSFRDFELLVVDDASTDDSVQIILAFRDQRIRLLRSPERLRICRALNWGLAEARGEYIARMDADDISHTARLATQVRFLERWPEIGMCGTWARRLKPGKPMQCYRRPSGFENIRAFALFDNPFIHASVMLRRRALEQNHLRYDETYVNAEDYDLWSRTFTCFPSDNLRRTLLDSREHNQSITYKAASDMNDKACSIVQRALAVLGLQPNEEDVSFHRQLGTVQWPVSPDRATIVRAENWLLSLILKNRQTGVYEPSALKRAIDSIWFSACYHGLPIGAWVVRRFLRSPLNTGRQRNALNSVLFLLAAAKYCSMQHAANPEE